MNEVTIVENYIRGIMEARINKIQELTDKVDILGDAHISYVLQN